MIPFSKEYIESKLFIKFDIQRFATLLRTWSTYYRISGTGSPGSYVFDTYGQIVVYLESQDLAANTSQIRIDHKTVIWRHSSAGSNYYAVVNNTSSYRANNGSYGGSYQSKSHNITRYGAAVTDSYTVGAGSTYHTVYHNSDGTCQLYINGSATLAITIYYPGGNNVFGSLAKASSFNMAIATIPRYANITGFSANNVTMNSFGFSVSTDAAIDYVQHSLNDGGWVDSGGQVITELQPGVAYSLRCRVRRADSGLWTESGYIYITTVDKAKITSHGSNFNFNIGTNQVITFSNPSGSPVNIFVDAPLGARILTRSNVSSPYTLVLSDAEKNTIYQSNINTKNIPLRIGVDTIYSGNTYYDWKDGTGTIVNSNPEMAMFNVEANDTKTKNLMGWINSVQVDNGKIIQSKTLLKITFGALTLKNYATLKKYNIIAGGQPYETTNSYIILTSGLTVNGSIIVEAVDSRDNKVSMTFPYTLIPYDTPSISNVVADRKDYPNDDKIHLSFEGKIAKLIYDTSEYLIKYRYKARESGALWSSLTTLAPDIDSNGNISYDEDLTVSFDTEKAYDIEVQISDYFTDTPITGTDFVTSTIPLLEITEDGIAVMGTYDLTQGGPLQVYGKPILDYESVDTW